MGGGVTIKPRCLFWEFLAFFGAESAFSRACSNHFATSCSIAKPFRENVAAIVLSYTPSGKATKATFEDYAGEITHDEYKELIAWLKERKFSHLVFSLRYPYGIQTEI